MSINQALTDKDFNRFRAMKEGAVEDMDIRTTDDIQGMVEVWRDGAPICFIITPDVDRDQVLEASYVAIRGLSPDRVIVAMDAHVSYEANNPKTGEPWKNGEMQAACDDDGACELGLITDCIVINDVTPDSYTMITLPYHVNKDAKQVHWQRDKDMTATSGGDEVLSGLVVDTIAGAFNERPFFEEFLEEVAEAGVRTNIEALEPEKVRLSQDAAIMVRLLSQGFGVVLTSPDQEWTEFVRGFINVALKDNITEMTG